MKLRFLLSVFSILIIRSSIGMEQSQTITVQLANDKVIAISSAEFKQLKNIIEQFPTDLIKTMLHHFQNSLVYYVLLKKHMQRKNIETKKLNLKNSISGVTYISSSPINDYIVAINNRFQTLILNWNQY